MVFWMKKFTIFRNVNGVLGRKGQSAGHERRRGRARLRLARAAPAPPARAARAHRGRELRVLAPDATAPRGVLG